MSMTRTAPFIRAVLRTIPRRDLDDLVKAFLGVDRPHAQDRADLLQLAEKNNSREFSVAVGDFVRDQLTREAPIS